MSYDRSERAQQLRSEARVGVFGKFLDIMTAVYGNPDLHNLERLIKKKREGHEVELYFPALDNSISITLTKTRLFARNGSSDKAVTKVIFDVPKKKIIPVFIELAHTRDTFFGLLKVILKYYLRRKIKVKGSIFTGITLLRLTFLGKHPLFENMS